MFTDQQRLVAAIGIALHAHGMQLDKGGVLYFLHPLHVMDKVKGTSAKIVAVSHDVPEDTDTTLDYYREHEVGFTREEIDAIDAITKRKGEKKRDYWARVKANPLALYVKLWDMAHTSSPARRATLPTEEERVYLRDKYNEARKYYAENDGLMPVINGWEFGDARKMLTAVGYEEDYWCEGWRLIMDANERGIIQISFDNIITLAP